MLSSKRLIQLLTCKVCQIEANEILIFLTRIQWFNVFNVRFYSSNDIQWFNVFNGARNQPPEHKASTLSSTMVQYYKKNVRQNLILANINVHRVNYFIHMTLQFSWSFTIRGFSLSASVTSRSKNRVPIRRFSISFMRWA